MYIYVMMSLCHLLPQSVGRSVTSDVRLWPARSAFKVSQHYAGNFQYGIICTHTMIWEVNSFYSYSKYDVHVHSLNTGKDHESVVANVAADEGCFPVLTKIGKVRILSTAYRKS